MNFSFESFRTKSFWLACLYLFKIHRLNFMLVFHSVASDLVRQMLVQGVELLNELTKRNFFTVKLAVLISFGFYVSDFWVG